MTMEKAINELRSFVAIGVGKEQGKNSHLAEITDFIDLEFDKRNANIEELREQINDKENIIANLRGQIAGMGGVLKILCDSKE